LLKVVKHCIIHKVTTSSPENTAPDVWTTPLNFEIAEIVDIARRIGSFALTDIHGVVVSAENVGAQHMLPTVYHAGLLEAQRQAGRVVTQVEEDYYRFGLLYGTRLGCDWYQDTTGRPMHADAWDAEEVAKRHVLTSYDQLAGTDWGPLRRHIETARERHLLGEHKLTILNAMAEPHIRAQLGHPYNHRTTDGEYGAFYSGLIDGTTFTYTYGRFRENKPPLTFDLADPNGLWGPLNGMEMHTLYFPQAQGDETTLYMLRFGKDGHYGDLAAEKVAALVDPLHYPDISVRLTLDGASFIMTARKYVCQKGWNRFDSSYSAQQAWPENNGPLPWEVPATAERMSRWRPEYVKGLLDIFNVDPQELTETLDYPDAPTVREYQGQTLADVLLDIGEKAGSDLHIEHLQPIPTVSYRQLLERQLARMAAGW